MPTQPMAVRADAPRAWLLVHKTVPDKPGKDILDRVNDPETRYPDEPPTFGICRTNIRRRLRISDHLFFVGHVREDPSGVHYYLSAHVKVGELIGHDEAYRRYGQRQGNVILEPAPIDAPETEMAQLESGTSS